MLTRTLASSTKIQADIVAWAREKLSPWQQDALRRIMLRGGITNEDLNELGKLCKISAGLNEQPENLPAVQPFDIAEIPGAEDLKGAVTLREVSSVENTNAVCSKQKLTFGPTALTIIFGYNGSGKSGYGRILRRACRSRHAGDPILANVLKVHPGAPASAEITFAIDGSEQPTSQWIDGNKYDTVLSQISFFDSSCARVHVGEKNDVAFTPYGLNVLEQLAQACMGVQESLRAEREILENQRPLFLSKNPIRESTSVAKLFHSLSGTSDVNRIRQLVSLDPTELLKLKTLPLELAQDPVKLASKTRTIATRIEHLNSLLTEAAESLSDDAIQEIQTLAVDCKEKQRAAEIAATVSFHEEPLRGVGSSVWRQLWTAAREYSVQIGYPDQQFPVADDDARCVLCQQTLDSNAKDRFRRFDAFVRDRTAVNARAALQTLDQRRISIEVVKAKSAR